MIILGVAGLGAILVWQHFARGGTLENIIPSGFGFGFGSSSSNEGAGEGNEIVSGLEQPLSAARTTDRLRVIYANNFGDKPGRIIDVGQTPTPTTIRTTSGLVIPRVCNKSGKCCSKGTCYSRGTCCDRFRQNDGTCDTRVCSAVKGGEAVIKATDYTGYRIPSSGVVQPTRIADRRTFVKGNMRCVNGYCFTLNSCCDKNRNRTQGYCDRFKCPAV